MIPKESQNIEWKESWRDEYIRWVCGFANVQGSKQVFLQNAPRFVSDNLLLQKRLDNSSSISTARKT